MISILMPVRNAGQYVAETLESIIAQSYGSWELIIVDDHSSDDSGDTIQKYCKIDSRINYHQNMGKGIIPALQTAIAQAKGEYITRMDADDIMPRNRLEKHLYAWERRGQVVTGYAKYFGYKSVSQGYARYQNWLNTNLKASNPWKNVYRECIIASPNWLIHREDLQKIGNFDRLQYPEDYHLVLKWYEAGYAIRLVEYITLYWREHPDRTSRSSPHYSQKYFFKLKIDEFLKIEKPEKAIIIWGSGQKSKLIEKQLTRHRFPFIRMTKENYRQIEAYDQHPLLVAVYPTKKERLAMESFLKSLNKVEGINYWYV